MLLVLARGEGTRNILEQQGGEFSGARGGMAGDPPWAFFTPGRALIGFPRSGGFAYGS